jgi:hypothetical protein
MSLTGELDKKDSPVTRWFAERVVNIKPISEEWLAAVKAAPLIRPVTDRRIPGTVGTAFDYRLRYWFAVTPLEELVASAGMRSVSLAAEPATSRRGASDALLALGGPAPPASTAVVALLPDFGTSLRDALAELSPVGRSLPPDDEQSISRYCYLLGLFEELFRGGLQIRSPLYELADGATVNDLLALPPQIWIDDLCALSTAFAGDYPALADGRVILNPTFAGSIEIGGADADLIVDGCLLDVKTTVDPKFTRTRVLYQLLGYALLDYDDRYEIDAVGVYLSRQALLLRWPLQPLLEQLLGRDDVSLTDLRLSFRDAVLAARVAPGSELARKPPKTTPA